MNVEWVNIEKERPDTGEFGISKQCVLKTSKGDFATGYYSKEFGDWVCDGWLFSTETIVAWLKWTEPNIVPKMLHID